MPLSDIVDLEISLETGGVTQAGFGIPGVLGYNAGFVERIRFYTSPDGVADDFAATTPEFKAASIIFSQTPRPPRIAIFRGLLKPTQRFELSVGVVKDNQQYSFNINTTTVSFTSGVATSNDLIITGLQAAAAVATAAAFTASVVGTPPNTVLRLNGNAAGNWIAVQSLNVEILEVVQNHVDPGVATDLAEIKLIDNTWYGLTTLYNSKLYAMAVAGFAEANEKLYAVSSSDSDIAKEPLLTATDLFQSLQAASFFRSAPIYHDNSGSFVDAAWLGLCLPLDPGSETWKFKTFAGVPATKLTATWQKNIQDKSGNIYYNVAGRNITSEGKVSSGEFIDVIRFRDWLKARMQERIATRLFNSKKVPFTDEGISIIENEIRAQLREGVTVGGLVDGFTVTVPKARDITPALKALRTLSLAEFDSVLAGAIHAVKIRGRITA